MEINLTLTEPQDDFVFSDAQYPLFVGGFGAGKSESLFKRLLIQKLAYPKLNQGYFAPTHDLIRLIAFPRISELLNECGLSFKLNKSEKTFTIAGYGQIILRSMDNPDSIVGFEIADAVIDELDTLKTEHAKNAWNKVIARCRQRKPDGKANTAAVGTTPEGFRFCYDRWQKRGGGKYVLYRAPTASNPYLPESYIEGLRESYPPQLLNAYLEGLFVNLSSGDGHPMALDELTKVRDTPAMAELIKERFPNHKIKIYPDAAGQSTSSKGASVSDHSILKAAGFEIVVDSTNPSIKDRINAMNAQICNGKGERSLLVNTDKCPEYTDALEQQAYDKNGMPDKEGGFDHVNDAGGYFIAKRFPIVKPNARTINLRMTY